MTPDLLPERIARRIVVNETTGCWEWQGARHRHGYGVAYLGRRSGDARRSALAHRYVYELLVGEIPDGMHADHQCHNLAADCEGGKGCRHRLCVRPDHIAMVTPAVNAVSSPTAAAFKRTQKTHCPKGHPYSGDNLWLQRRKNGGYSRACLACHGPATRRVAS